MNKPLSVILKDRRSELGMTQKEVYEKAPISKAGYTNIEQGRVVKPMRIILESICKVLDLQFDEVVKDAGLVYTPVKSN